MTRQLLTTPAGARKVVVDTCAVLRGRRWHDEHKPRVQTWLGADGMVVLHGRVVTELALVAAAKGLRGSKDAGATARRAEMALTAPGRMLGLEAARRAVLTRADVGVLCRDSGDLELVRPTDEGGRCVPGDADFEIAHTVRVLTAAAHDACLLTDDGDLNEAAERLGVAVLGGEAPPSRPGTEPTGAVAYLPDPQDGRTVHLLGLEAATALLEGRLPVPGTDGDVLVVLSSTVVRAAQRAALAVPRDDDGKPDAAVLAEVQERLRRLLSGASDGPATYVWATPWSVYRLAAERVSDRRYTCDAGGDRPVDMHSLLVLAAAEALGRSGHAVRVASSGRDADRDLLLTAMASWRRAGVLTALAGAAHNPRGTDGWTDVPLPDEGLDLGALLDRFRRR